MRHPATLESAPASPPVVDASSGRRALGGLFVSGMMLSFPGAFLPAWGYHLNDRYLSVGLLFVLLNAGVYTGYAAALAAIPRRGIQACLVLGAALSCAGFLFLALAAGDSWLRMGGMFWLGISAGMLNTAIFHAITPLYQLDPAATLNLGGMFFGFGCLYTSLLVSGAFNFYSVPSMLMLLAVVPGYFLISYAKGGPVPSPSRDFAPVREAWRDFRSVGAILFSLLLFFQFGNEFSIAGWLPLYLIQQLGLSPTLAVLLLALFWTALLIGRIVSQAILQRVRHSRLLLGSVVAALIGCLLLGATARIGGAIAGILLVGAGFASVYPLTAERIAHRFPYYHPGFFNGIFSLGITGGLMAPAVLGLTAHFGGISTVMVLPSLGALAVCILVLGIWLEARLTTARVD